MNNFNNQGISDELGDYFSSGRITKVIDSGPLEEALSKRFPFCLNRVDWNKIPEHAYRAAESKADDGNESPEAYFERCAPIIRSFILDALGSAGAGEQDRLFWLGDATDFALEMRGETLVEVCSILFSYPQHNYIIPQNGAWCISYTMEDELYFGFAVREIT